MTKHHSTILLFVASLLLFFSTFSSKQRGQAETAGFSFPFQISLENEQGVSFPDGSYELTFIIYDSSKKRKKLWGPETQQVSITNMEGVVLLGKVKPVIIDFDQRSKPMSLGIVANKEKNPMLRLELQIPIISSLQSKFSQQSKNAISLANEPGKKLIDEISKIKGLEDRLLALEKLNSPPVGSVLAYVGHKGNINRGWLICDGRSLSCKDYPELFRQIRYGHGSENGASLDQAFFNLPDFRGQFLRGVSGSSGNDPEKESRKAAKLGGNSGNTVGSIQDWSVGPHKHLYRLGAENQKAPTTGDNIRPSFLFSNGTEIYTTRMKNHVESRPKNVNVYWIIRASR